MVHFIIENKCIKGYKAGQLFSVKSENSTGRSGQVGKFSTGFNPDLSSQKGPLETFISQFFL